MTDYGLPLMATRALAPWRWPDCSWGRLSRRVRAIGRLIARRRRAGRRFADLQHLDDRTLRDLGVTRSEIASIVSELGGGAAATRRRAD
ncbi:MAG: DUF1127 domain-containing protein [Burkholderiaceae bacterium]